MTDKYPDVVVAYLERSTHLMHCTDCAPVNAGYNPLTWCAVYRVNIGVYSQDCHVCGRLIVEGVMKADGSGPLCIFERPADQV